MIITLPTPALLLLIGSAGAGKSTFAARHFLPTEVVSSDRCRALICDDEAEQAVTRAAFGLVRRLVYLRLRYQRLTVVDATNLEAHARLPLLRLAQHFELPALAIVFAVSAATSAANNARRTRIVPAHILAQHETQLAETLTALPHEGYRDIIHLTEVNRDLLYFRRIATDTLSQPTPQ